ncbi:MAG: energy-coupled thiamine transporter ThiT [Erysipelotrichaceae bacterium]|nr:energy-coupled thiamine transporter ThiT [Erysipelotrichaceae bacterium]
MKRNRVLDLSFMAIYVALANVLEYFGEFIPFLKMPQGGSISLAVIPVFIASYHLGYKKGMAVGFYWWLVGFMFGKYQWYINQIQYILDYIIPMTMVGFASFLPKVKKVNNVYVGVFFMGVIRFLCTLLSGVYFWFPEGSVAGSSAAWINSFGYNFYYNFATLVVAIIVVPLLINSLNKTKYKFNYVKK